MELKRYLRILQRWGWILVCCVVATTGASYWVSEQSPSVYAARARYLVGPVLDNPLVTSNDLRASSQIGQTYAELATSRPVLQSVIDRLGLSMGARDLASEVTATWIDSTQILNVRVRAADPALAATIANAVGEALIERSPGGATSQQEARREEAEAAIARQTKGIEALSVEIDQLLAEIQGTTDPTAQRALIARLDQQRDRLASAQQELRLLRDGTLASSTNQIAVLEPAVLEPKAIAPQVEQNVLAGLLAGLVLGLAAMLLCEYLMGAIYSPEQLGPAARTSYLGGILRHRRLSKGGIRQLVTQMRPDTMEAESYRILGATLRMGPDSYPPTLLVTSPAHGEGKSEIAANLAVTFANAGLTVILVDANLRRPRVAELFGVPAQIGLANLGDQPETAITPVPVSWIPCLSVVPAGRGRSDGSEILGTPRMDQFIQRLSEQADIVIFDSPPLLYSDALALARRVSGVLLVGSVGRTKTETLEGAVESLHQVGARRVGTVLNQVKANSSVSYAPARRERSVAPNGRFGQRRSTADSYAATSSWNTSAGSVGEAAATALKILEEAGFAPPALAPGQARPAADRHPVSGQNGHRAADN